jgi:ABC-type transport system involved in Fe-S cluster assembly fused permease/ATPase subunit
VGFPKHAVVERGVAVAGGEQQRISAAGGLLVSPVSQGG